MKHTMNSKRRYVLSAECCQESGWLFRLLDHVSKHADYDVNFAGNDGWAKIERNGLLETFDR
jgi:hypothetical protein